MAKPLIAEGDIVDVFYVNGEHLFDVELVYTPSNVGELYYFRTADGHVYAQNPMSANFDAIHKFPRQRVKP